MTTTSKDDSVAERIRRGVRDLPIDLGVESWKTLNCAECRRTITEYDPRIPTRIRGWCKRCEAYTILDTYSRIAERFAERSDGLTSIPIDNRPDLP